MKPTWLCAGYECLFTIDIDGHVNKLFDGEWFGITRHRNFVWAYCKSKYCVIKFRVRWNWGQLRLAQVEQWYSRNFFDTHQVDRIKGHITLACPVYDKYIILFGRKPIHYYPLNPGFSKADEIPKEENNQRHHVNSVFTDGIFVYLMLHNRWLYAHKHSQLAILDYAKFPTPEVLNIKDLDGADCHNIYVDEGRLVFLDSRGGRVMLMTVNPFNQWSEVLWRCDRYLRGLSYCDDLIAIGSSKMEKERSQRVGPGKVHVLDRRTCNEVVTLDVPDTIRDLRRMDRPDRTISNYRHGPESWDEPLE